MSKGREFYENTNTIKAYRKARFHYDLNLKRTSKQIQGYIDYHNKKRNNSPYIKYKLKQAIQNEKIKNRKYERRQAKINAINNSAPLIQNSYVLKWCIALIVLMTLLTFNATGSVGISSNIKEQVHEETEVQYTNLYKNMYYEEYTGLTKLTATAEAVAIFGQNNAWIEIINSISNVNDFSSGLEMIGTLFIAPVNLGIDLIVLFVNIFNSWTGKVLIQPPTIKYTRALRDSLFGIPLPKYIWHKLFD